VLQTAKGGVASAWMLREMAARNKSPKAIIFDRANTILAQGAAASPPPGVAQFRRIQPASFADAPRTGYL